MSGLGWIHFSETTHRNVLKVIDILSGGSSAIDELGIGVVRDAFSNELFAGVSTIMTRGRYFYTIPYLLIDYLRNPSYRKDVTQYMKDEETKMMGEIIKNYLPNPQNQRIIGYTVGLKNNKKNGRIVDRLVRNPSEIYWGGIRTFGIFKGSHSFAQLCYAINQGKYIDVEKDNKDGSGDDESDYESWLELFDVPYKKNWNRHQLELTLDEAEHFKNKIAEIASGGFLSIVLSNNHFIEEFLQLKSFSDLPTTLLYKHLEDKHKHYAKVITTAIQFWQLLKGAHIRFNILLQNRQHEENQKSFDNHWVEWQLSLQNFNWDSFDITFMWNVVGNHNKRIKQTISYLFINDWIDAIKNHKSEDELDRIVKLQERRNKKDRSKLNDNHSVVYTEWVGISQLEYRLRNVQTIVRDIANPLISYKTDNA